MTVPKVDPITPISSSSPSPHFLEVGILKIEGREYTVSVESPNPLIKRPHGDTLDRIQDLVNLHLNHLREEGVDLSTVVVQQLDEEGLSYVKATGDEDIIQMRLASSEVHFESYNPFADTYSSYPKSLQDASILNISDAYRSLIESLAKKSESESEEESRVPINKRNLLDEDTNFEPRIEQTKPKQLVESSDEGSDIEEEDEISDSEDENVGLISGKSKNLRQYNQIGIINSIKSRASSLFSRIQDFLPNLRHETDAIDPEEIIAREESKFRSNLSSSEQATLTKFATTNFG